MSNAFEQYLAQLEVDRIVREARAETHRRIETAKNWTGLYLYPGLREEKKEETA